jgi:hypothetical protein
MRVEVIDAAAGAAQKEDDALFGNYGFVVQCKMDIKGGSERIKDCTNGDACSGSSKSFSSLGLFQADSSGFWI